jgi:hypothetical protein
VEKTKLEWAKYIAERGLRIIPLHHTRVNGSCSCGRPTKPSDPDDKVKGIDYCGSPGKHPKVDAWQDVATSDYNLIQQWFKSDPAMNYGCVAGTDKFILDIDVKDANGYDTAARLLGVPMAGLDTYTFSVKTPSGGEHLYFDADKVYANSVKRALGEGLDVRSGNGFVVGPGSTLHIPEEFVPDNFVPVSYEVVSDQSFTALPDSIKSRMREAMVRAANAQGSEDPDSIDSDENIAEGIRWLKTRDPAEQGGGGDEHTLVTSQIVRDCNVSEDVCYDLMLEHYNDKCDPPWDPEELRVKVRNGYKYANRPMGTKRVVKKTGSTFNDSPSDIELAEIKKQLDYDGVPSVNATDKKGKKDKREFIFYDGSMVLTAPIHYEFILDGWLPDKNYTIVLGSRGSGKTTVIVDAVCHIVSDAPWHGTEVDPGWFVIYIAGEDFAGVKDRYEAWCAQHQNLCNWNDETERWEIKDPSRIQFIDFAVNLLDDDKVTEFGKAVVKLAASKMDKEGNPAKIVFVIDTWQRMTSAAVGGQSSDESMQKALDNIESLADRFNGPCIIAAHPPKANQTTMAGSGIIENRSDALWSIEPNDGGIREAKVTRVKGTKEGNNKRLGFFDTDINGFDKFGRRRSSVAIRYQGGGVDGDPSKNVTTPEETQRNQKILSLMRDILARRNEYCPTYPDNPTQSNITKMVMDLYESDEYRTKENKVGNETIRKEWIAAFEALGFVEYDMKRSRQTRLAATKHPFYLAMDRLQYMFKGQGEIGTSGMGIRWSKTANTTVKLSYGPIERPSLMDKMEDVGEDEQVDPNTDEVTKKDEPVVDEDFGYGDI